MVCNRKIAIRTNFFFIICFFKIFIASAFTFNGVNYSIISGTTNVSVTGYQCNASTLVLPNTVNFDNINYTVTSIGSYSFYGCTSLSSVTLPNSVTTIGDGAFANCSGLSSIIFSNSLTSIGNFVFQFCSGLVSITIPNSVLGIGDGAFASCTSLTTVSIPGSLLLIGDNAFVYCSNLSTIYNYSTLPIAINSNVFFSVNQSNCMLYVPIGSQALYQSAPVWQNFAPILTLSNESFNSNSSIMIYPNPVIEDLFIEIPKNVTIDKICINDITGKVVFEQNYFTESINLSYLQSGNYIIKLTSSNNIISKKFIKINN